MKRDEPYFLTDSEGDYINPKYLDLKPGMVVPRVPAYRYCADVQTNGSASDDNRDIITP